MKLTILYIIVKQWFKDKSGTELDDAVVDAIIKELTEETKSTNIHYESEKHTKDKACKIAEDIIKKNIQRPNITDIDIKQEQTFITKTQTMFIAEVEFELDINPKSFVINAKDHNEARQKIRKHFFNTSIKINIKDYEYIK